MAGAGAFSDGKYVISTEYGGWLTEFLEPETVIDYIEQADKILVKFGATTERFMPATSLKGNVSNMTCICRRLSSSNLGTDSNFDTMRKLINDPQDPLRSAYGYRGDRSGQDTRTVTMVRITKNIIPRRNISYSPSAGSAAASSRNGATRTMWS